MAARRTSRSRTSKKPRRPSRPSRRSPSTPSVRTTVRVASSRAPSAVPWIMVGVGVLAVGSAVWLYTRSAQATPAPVSFPAAPGTPPSTPITPPPQTTFAPPPPSSTPTVTAPAKLTQVISRLKTSDTARQVYAFQAELYSTYFTDALPDGVIGPITRGLISQVTTLDGTPTTGFSPSLINSTPLTLASQWTANPHNVRVIPDRLPNDVIALVNGTIRRYSTTAPLLQAMPS